MFHYVNVLCLFFCTYGIVYIYINWRKKNVKTLYDIATNK